jgi:hypothetical protein
MLPLGPAGPMMLRSSAAGWLVRVFSLLSRKTDAAPTPEMAMPKFVAGLEIQLCTTAVTSTRTKALAVVTGAELNAAAVVGDVLKVTVPSAQGEVTSAYCTAPAVVTLSTKTRRNAAATFALAGMPLRSNCTKAVFPGAMLKVGAVPKFVVGDAELMYASAASVPDCAHKPGSSRVPATRARMIVRFIIVFSSLAFSNCSQGWRRRDSPPRNDPYQPTG